MHSQKPISHYFLRSFFLLALCLTFLTSPALAFKICRCTDKDITPLERYDRAFGVFTGKVQKVRRRLNPDAHHVTFDVYDSWKGVRFEEVIITTSGTDYAAVLREGITCGYDFNKGDEFLIFSYRNHNDRGLSSTSACGNIIPLTQASAYIDYFGKPSWQFNLPPLPVTPVDPTHIDPTTQQVTIPPILPMHSPTLPSN